MDRSCDRKGIMERFFRGKEYLCNAAVFILWVILVCGGLIFFNERNRELRWQQLTELSVIYPEQKENLQEAYDYYETQRKYDFGRMALYMCLAGAFCLGIEHVVLLRRGNKQQEENQEILEELSEELEQFLKGTVSLGKVEEIRYERAEWEAFIEKLQQLGYYFSDLKQRLEREENETKALITDISHQLKTPLSSLRMSHELLEAENLSEAERQEFMEKEEQEIGRLEKLLEELVQLSRLESHMIQIRPEWTELRKVLTEAVNKVFFKAYEKNIAIEIRNNEREVSEAENTEDIELVADNLVFCDPVWTVEAFANVLENAVKYSGEYTTITVTVGRLTSLVYVDITDEGIGISTEEMHLIFQRFYRGREAQKRVKDGAGVGLYLTRRILEEQGGTIMAERKQNGSCFRMTLRYDMRDKSL